MNIGELAKVCGRRHHPRGVVAAAGGLKSLFKVLGGGDVGGARKVAAHAFSAAAKAKIEQAGGACEILS